MILYVVRAVFVTIVAYIALSYAEEVYQEWEPIKVLTVALVGSVAVIALDLAFPRKSLLGLTGVLAGIVVGLVRGNRLAWQSGRILALVGGAVQCVLGVKASF